MKKMIILFLFITFSSIGNSQNTIGKIIGKVIENSGSKAVSGETVLLFKDDTQFASARSGSGGNFSFVSVESGEYLVKIKKQGYQTYTKKIRINPNFTTKLVVVLEPAGQERESKIANQPVDAKRPVELKSKTENLLAANQKSDQKSSQILNPQDAMQEKSESVIPAEPEQIAIDKNAEPEFYDAVEEMSEPVGGWASLMKNIEYPADASKLNIQGNVYLQAFISKEGEVTNIIVLKSVPMLDLSAQEAVYKTKFKPGTIGGEIVNSKITIKVPFKLGR